jgi:N-methylhydantoinase B
MWTKWEITTDSPGAGRWRGGGGFESTFILEADEMDLAESGEHYRTLPGPAVAGGHRPPQNSLKIITRADGRKEEGTELFSVLKRGEELTCYCQGGCGVGDPLDREIEIVRKDVLNEIVSSEKAREIYGVVMDPMTFEVNGVDTQELRSEMKKQK